MNDKAIEVQELRKNFGDVYAVQGVSFDVQRGEIFSLLGPNGAGKSTTIAMLACLLKPTDGDACVMGHSIVHEPTEVRAALGVVPQDIAIYPDLSARENLNFWGKMYGLRGSMLKQRVDEVLEIIAGHLLAMFCVVFIQEVILIGFGQIAFGVNYLREPIATLLVMIAFGLWIASLGLFVGVIAKREDQVVLFSLIAMFIFTPLTGAWFSLEGTGPAFAAIGHLTPGAWAMDGFQNIVVRGLAFDSVLLPVGVLIAYAILFLGLGVWRFTLE